MSEFKPAQPKDKRKGATVTLVIFSALLALVIAGAIRMISMGLDDRSEYLPHMIIGPIATFFVIRSVLILKGKSKPKQFPKEIIEDLGLLVLFIFSAGGMVFAFLAALHEEHYGGMVFSVVLCGGMAWAAYMVFRRLSAHWAVYALVRNSKTASAENVRDQLMKIEQLKYIKDVNSAASVPYIDHEGILSIYDDNTVAEKVAMSLHVHRKTIQYVTLSLDRKNLVAYMQELYDRGFRSIRYETSMGGVDIPLREFLNYKTEDPVHCYASRFLVCEHVARQHLSRYAYLKQAGCSDEVCSAMRSIASEETNHSITELCHTVFYTVVLPDGTADDNVLKFSQDAFDVCTKEGLIEAMSFDRINRKMIYHDEAPRPYLSKNFSGELVISAFTQYEKACAYLADAKKELEKFEKHTPEEEKLKHIGYWSKMKDLVRCELCVMTGKEIAASVMAKNCEYIQVNFKQQIARDMIEGYIADLKKEGDRIHG